MARIPILKNYLMSNIVAFEIERTGLAAFLFAIFRPGIAKTARVDTETVRLTSRNGSTIVPLGNLEEVNVADGLVWSSVCLRHSSGSATISGLPQNATAALVHAVETARRDWWRRVLGALAGVLKPVHDRISQLSSPPKYVTTAEMRKRTKARFDTETARRIKVSTFHFSLNLSRCSRFQKNIAK